MNTVYNVHINLYIYTYIPKSSNPCCFYKQYHINASSCDFDFGLELLFLRNPYIYVSPTSMQKFINIDPRKLCKIPTLICN